MSEPESKRVDATETRDKCERVLNHGNSTHSFPRSRDDHESSNSKHKKHSKDNKKHKHHRHKHSSSRHRHRSGSGLNLNSNVILLH